MKHLCGAEVFLYKTLAVSLDQQRLVKVTPVGFHTGTGVSVATTGSGSCRLGRMVKMTTNQPNMS